MTTLQGGVSMKVLVGGAGTSGGDGGGGGQQAARKGDHHSCPETTPVPHEGGPIDKGETTVLVGGKPQARIGDTAKCIPSEDVIIEGEPTVLVGGQPAARKGDQTAHGGEIDQGEPTVLIGKKKGSGSRKCACMKNASQNGAPASKADPQGGAQGQGEQGEAESGEHESAGQKLATETLTSSGHVVQDMVELMEHNSGGNTTLNAVLKAAGKAPHPQPWISDVPTAGMAAGCLLDAFFRYQEYLKKHPEGTHGKVVNLLEQGQIDPKSSDYLQRVSNNLNNSINNAANTVNNAVKGWLGGGN